MPPSGTHGCATCGDNFIVNSKLIACTLCGEKYHINCVKIKDQFLKTITDSKNLFWFCDNCADGIKEKLDITKNLRKLEENIQECRQNTIEILNQTSETKLLSQNNEQWSDIVKKKVFPPLIIRPKNVSQDSKTTKTVVEQKIKPNDLSVSVNKFKSVRQGCVMIECNDGDSLKKLQNKAVAELSEEYEVEISKLINPKVVVVGVKKEHLTSPEEFLDIIRTQNCLSNTSVNEIKFIKKYVPKRKPNLNNVILEVSAEIMKCLQNVKRVFFDWTSYPVYEYLGVLRCYKCWKYGHRAIHCRHETVVCPLCNKNHKGEECSSDSFECTNCKYAHDVLKIKNIEFKHTVFDKNCASYHRAIDQLKGRTQYT